MGCDNGNDGGGDLSWKRIRMLWLKRIWAGFSMGGKRKLTEKKWTNQEHRVKAKTVMTWKRNSVLNSGKFWNKGKRWTNFCRSREERRREKNKCDRNATEAVFLFACYLRGVASNRNCACVKCRDQFRITKCLLCMLSVFPSRYFIG